MKKDGAAIKLSNNCRAVNSIRRLFLIRTVKFVLSNKISTKLRLKFHIISDFDIRFSSSSSATSTVV